MRYFLPDSQDTVDPSFDFETEKRSLTRQRQRDDQYAHELFRTRAYDGLLVSKGIVDGFGETGSRYTLAQRHRLMRSGAHEFFRTKESSWGKLDVMGDCGAFTYVREDVPPYSVEQVANFYVECGFDLGVSVDHVILQYEPEWDTTGTVPKDVTRRQEITVELAREFFRLHRRERLPFELLGAAQGWSPRSYAHSLKQLQKIGYRYVAVGGMVPLKTSEIMASLRGMDEVRLPDTRLHLLGVTRTENLSEFERLGVGSLDSTSPLRQAFKDEKDNYYTLDRAFTAIRVPQVQGNPKLQRAILSGRTSQDTARLLEKRALEAMRLFDMGECSIDKTLEHLQRYDELFAAGAKRSPVAAYRETLEAQPWKECPCDVCKRLGHHVILFRGAERNRRRGLHNVWTFYRRLQRDLKCMDKAS
jgi:hypothetical protein